MLFSIALIVLGLLAIPSLIISKKPQAKELFDKVAPYQGWFGVIFAIIGIVDIIITIINIRLLTVVPIWWILSLLIAAVEIALGFILGYSLIHKYVLSKNAEADEKGKELLNKLLPLQGKLGVVAIILGVLGVIGYFVWMVH
jgi:hypothetical protein